MESAGLMPSVYILTGWAKGPDNSLYALAYDGIFRVVKR